MRLSTRAMVAVWLTMLDGCVNTLPADSPDQHAIDDVLEAWNLNDLPSPGECLDLVEVRRHKTKAAYVDVCEGLSPGAGGRESAVHSAGCQTYALKGVAGKRAVVINLAPGFHNDMGLVQHEALHALVECTMQRPVTDPWDSEHTDPRIWAASGGADSAQSKALTVGSLTRQPP